MRKIYYYLELENISPIHIGNGDNIFTDLDVLKDKNNEFFIPGTSLAGCIFHSLNEKEKAIFNPKMNSGLTKQSPFYISDARMLKNFNGHEVRDGIKLDKNKTTLNTGKYDYEVIPSGQHFEMCVEIVDRGHHDYEMLMHKILVSIQNQDIKVGYKTTRGLGRLKIVKAGKKVFDENNFNEYFTFNRYNVYQYDILEIENILSEKYTRIEVQLKQKGGISIRTYNTSKEDVDYEHIRSQGVPVIPATSWNGMIRRSIEDYIEQFDLNIPIEDVFGDVRGNSVKKKSHVYIDESVLEGGYDKVQTRVSINPFHAGNVNGALYKEKSYYGGRTSLVISIDKTMEYHDLIKKLIVIVLKDIDEGFVALGGETSIGRGLFTVENIEIDGQQIEFKEYMEEVTC